VNWIAIEKKMYIKEWVKIIDRVRTFVLKKLSSRYKKDEEQNEFS